MSDPYDGKPYYCTTCGERYSPFRCGQGCQEETKETAQSRARRRRPMTSSLGELPKE